VAFPLGATTFGRRVYAVGNNPGASYLAGINTRLLTVALFMLSGMFAAMAGSADAARGRCRSRSTAGASCTAWSSW
jgi:ribose transport system permease protein